jgi:uncharacterized protein
MKYHNWIYHPMDEYKGNVTGNVVGNVTGNVIGNVTGNVIGNVDGSVNGCVNGEAFSQHGPDHAVAVTEKVLADPMPLAMLGIAFSALFFGLWCLNILKLDAVTLLMIGIGGLIAVIAGVREYMSAETFSATAFSSIGIFFIIMSLVFAADSLGFASVDTRSTCAVMLLWGSITMFLCIMASSVNLALQICFASLAIALLTFAILYYEQTSFAADLRLIAGLLCSICGMIAIYISVGSLINDHYGQDILPLDVEKR